VIDTIVAKYCDSLPLYRQSAILKRDTGIEISRSTMDGWVMRWGELLMPIAGVMRKELLAGSYIQADETPVDVQMHDGSRPEPPSLSLAVRHSGGGVVFDFRMGREREGLSSFLKSSMASCRPTAMLPTTTSAGRRWSMPAVSHTQEGRLSKP